MLLMVVDTFAQQVTCARPTPSLRNLACLVLTSLTQAREVVILAQWPSTVLNSVCKLVCPARLVTSVKAATSTQDHALQVLTIHQLARTHKTIAWVA